MRHQPPKDRALLRAKVDALQARGVVPDCDDIVDLMEACRRVVNPHRDTALDLLDCPTLCGRLDEPVKLWPHSIASATWLYDLAQGWFRDSPRLWVLACVYAHAHARERVFLTLTSRQEAVRAILDWSLGCTATVSELMEGLAAVTGAGEATDADAKADSQAVACFRRVVDDLEAMSGLPREHWLYGRAAQSVCAAYSRARRLHAAAFAPAGYPADDSDSEADAAVAALQKTIVRILSKHGVEVRR